MEFEENAQLDTSQVDDQRKGGRIPGGKVGMGVGAGGLAGIIALVVALLSSGGGGGAGSIVDQLTQQPAVDSGEVVDQGGSEVTEACKTGADANERQDCRIVAVVNSVQQYWADTFQQGGRTYTPSTTRLFSGQTQTGCGPASSATGPFYCPADQTVYIDLSFFDVLTKPPFDAKGGPFAEAYVVAHEYGHHIQTLVGQGDNGDREGADSGSVRLELQADCYAGAWGHSAAKRGKLEPGDMEEGLRAASAIGDDNIQRQTQGRVAPESFTHGSSEQRLAWFRRGLETGDPRQCDTFAAQ